MLLRVVAGFGLSVLVGCANRHGARTAHAAPWTTVYEFDGPCDFDRRGRCVLRFDSRLVHFSLAPVLRCHLGHVAPGTVPVYSECTFRRGVVTMYSDRRLDFRTGNVTTSQALHGVHDVVVMGLRHT